DRTTGYLLEHPAVTRRVAVADQIRRGDRPDFSPDRVQVQVDAKQPGITSQLSTHEYRRANPGPGMGLERANDAHRHFQPCRDFFLGEPRALPRLHEANAKAIDAFGRDCVRVHHRFPLSPVPEPDLSGNSALSL